MTRLLRQAMPALAIGLIVQPQLEAQDPSTSTALIMVNTTSEPVAGGKFKPTWKSLEQYRVPDWFRDAKFGIWAHWGPQCQPERGDWYARDMYLKDNWRHRDHKERFGDPARFGFKDVINDWRAENFKPDELVALYKRAGAQYFFAMANHHDNFDMWDSTYQPWNSVALGPKKNIIEGWSKAARAHGLKFGVSIHAAHAWTWYEPSQDFDGRLSKADGVGTWWEGLDPMTDLYAQNHPRSAGSERADSLFGQWNWDNGASTPDQAYCDKFYNRTVDLINKYKPDLIYFDDTVLPLWPVSDAGLKIASHYYNSSMKWSEGKLEVVLFGKILNEQQRKCLVWDIERGQSPGIEPLPYQTDTCIGGWHYDRGIYERGDYKSTQNVIRMLVDVVSKNGNLLLNVPVRADGTIDEKERAIVEEIGAWMDVNKEAIFGTRPWKVCGEGPQLAASEPMSGPGFNEGKGKPFSAQDIRYTAKGDVLYAFVLGKPDGEVRFTKLGTTQNLLGGRIAKVEQLGAEQVQWKQTDAALVVTPDVAKVASADQTLVFRVISMR